jgi:hypothetical protein
MFQLPCHGRGSHQTEGAGAEKLLGLKASDWVRNNIAAHDVPHQAEVVFGQLAAVIVGSR